MKAPQTTLSRMATVPSMQPEATPENGKMGEVRRNVRRDAWALRGPTLNLRLMSPLAGGRSRATQTQRAPRKPRHLSPRQKTESLRANGAVHLPDDCTNSIPTPPSTRTSVWVLCGVNSSSSLKTNPPNPEPFTLSNRSRCRFSQRGGAIPNPDNFAHYTLSNIVLLDWCVGSHKGGLIPNPDNFALYAIES